MIKFLRRRRPFFIVLAVVGLATTLAGKATPLTPDLSFDPLTLRALTAIVESGKGASD